MELIDRIIFINLAHRTDRLAELMAVLADGPGGVDLRPKAERFEGIRAPHYVGAARSHVAVLERIIAGPWETVLVLEDDAFWTSKDDSQLRTLLQGGTPPTPDALPDDPGDIRVYLAAHRRLPLYNVIMLGACDLWRDGYRVITATCCHAYVVRRAWAPCLLANFREGLELLERTGDNRFVIDQHWKILMRFFNFYVVAPPMLMQRPGMSDSAGHFIDYSGGHTS